MKNIILIIMVLSLIVCGCNKSENIPQIQQSEVENSNIQVLENIEENTESSSDLENSSKPIVIDKNGKIPYRFYSREECQNGGIIGTIMSCEKYILSGMTVSVGSSMYEFFERIHAEVLFSVYNADDLKNPIIEFALNKLDEDEILLSWNLSKDDNLIIKTSKRVIKISVENAEILREINLTNNFREMASKPENNRYNYNYVVDDELNYIAYSFPEGFYAESLNGEKFIKISDVERNEIGDLNRSPYEIINGKVSYVDEFLQGYSYMMDKLYCSLDKLKYFDIEKEKEVEPDIKIPTPKNKGIDYVKVIGDKVIGVGSLNGDKTCEIEILDLKTNKILTVPLFAETSKYLVADGLNLSLITIGDDVYSFFIEEDQSNKDTTAAGINFIRRLRKVNLETGELSAPLAEVSCYSAILHATKDAIIIDYYNDNQGGIIVVGI